jgi:phage baseplate assembly protein V
MTQELYSNLRGLANVGQVIAVDDSGQAQKVTVRTGDNVERADVEVMMPFGFSSMPPLHGAICMLVAIGADPANLRALPIGAPSRRFGGQQPGEAVMYAQDGTRVAVRQGGIVDVWGAEQVNVHTKTCTINAPAGCVINAAAGTTVNGDALVNGNVEVTGNISGTGA